MLIIGYIATSYLAGCYLSIDFEVTAVSQFIAAIIVSWYFVAELGFNGRRFIPCIIFHTLTCVMVSIKIEIKDKEEYLERKTNEQLKQDLSHILLQFPEAVIIATKEKEP